MSLMTFDQYERLIDLMLEPRTMGGDPMPWGQNYVVGLIQLVRRVKPKSVIEIGSYRGVSSEVFALLCDRVVCIDNWPGGDQFDNFKKRIGVYPHVEFYQDDSPQALDRFADGEFDLCYIDAMHDYDSVAADIKACQRIVKSNGWLSGHDYAAAGGVDRAVKDLLGEPEVFSDTSWLYPNSPARRPPQPVAKQPGFAVPRSTGA
jgi:cephalosporin hydroxylase